MDVEIERELKRNLLKLCTRELVELLVVNGEEFYQSLFRIYGLIFSKDTMRAKRKFVNVATVYYILNRLSNCVETFEEPANKFALLFEKSSPEVVIKYQISDIESFNTNLNEHLTKILTIMSKYKFTRYVHFENEFAKSYNINKLPLEKYLKLRLEDNETKFLKALRQVASGKYVG